MITEILKQEEYDQWLELVNQANSGSIYSYPDYLAVLSEVTGASFKILAVKENKELVGGIGIFERKRIATRYIAPRLMLYYNGIVLRDYDSRYPSKCTSRHLKILEAIRETLSSSGYGKIVFKNRHPFMDARVFLQAGWMVRPTYSYVAHIANPDALWQKMEQNQRRLVKRCEDEKFIFSESDDFEGFFNLHMGVHERKHAPLYLPYDQFKQYYNCLKNRNLCHLFTVKNKDGKMVAGQLALTGGHPVTHTVSAAADPEYQNLGINPFLRWYTFKQLAEWGYTHNDLTDAALNMVTRFKSQLGADLVVNLEVVSPSRMLYRFEDALLNSADLAKRAMKKIKRLTLDRIFYK